MNDVLIYGGIALGLLILFGSLFSNNNRFSGEYPTGYPPVVIVQQSEPRMGLGWIAAILIGGFVGFALIDSGGQDNSDFEALPQNTPVREDAPSPNVRINESPPVPMEHPVWRPASVSTNTEEQATKINVAPEVKAQRPSPPPIWAVTLRKYPQKTPVLSLSRRYNQRGIEPVLMPDGSYLACIFVDDKAAGDEEARDWKRHQSDWSGLGLTPQTVNLSKICQSVVREIGSDECKCEASR